MMDALTPKLQAVYVAARALCMHLDWNRAGLENRLALLKAVNAVEALPNYPGLTKTRVET